MKNSFKYAFVGAERSGKSYYAKRVINSYTKNIGSSLVYNVGKLDDFPDEHYFWIRPLGFDDHKEFLGKERSKKYKNTIELFEFAGKIYHFKYFNNLFLSKKVKLKCYRIDDKKAESEFFLTLQKYVSKCLIVFDDCRPLFRAGLTSRQISLLNRTNHSGLFSSLKKSRGLGNDLIFIFHNIDHVNTEIWDYLTGIIQFRFEQKPSCKKFDNYKLEKLVLKVHEQLKREKKYACYEIKLAGKNSYQIKKANI